MDFNLCRYKESMELIKKLERVGKEMSSTVADGWFYAGCLNFLLYTGMHFISHYSALK